MEGWIWLVGGMMLVMLELIVPSFTIVWFGLAALVVGALVWIFPSITLAWQILAWTVLSIVSGALWFRFGRRGATNPVGTASDGVVGTEGIVTEVDGKTGTVTFQTPVLGASRWPCICDRELKNGAKVRITAIVGHKLEVKEVV